MSNKHRQTNAHITLYLSSRFVVVFFLVVVVIVTTVVVVVVAIAPATVRGEYHARPPFFGFVTNYKHTKFSLPTAKVPPTATVRWQKNNNNRPTSCLKKAKSRGSVGVRQQKCYYYLFHFSRFSSFFDGIQTWSGPVSAVKWKPTQELDKKITLKL